MVVSRFLYAFTIADRLTGIEGMVARIAADLVRRIRELTVAICTLEREITDRVKILAPTLLLIVGVGALGAAKIVAETADVRRFKSNDAYARHNGTAPLPVWSGNRERHWKVASHPFVISTRRQSHRFTDDLLTSRRPSPSPSTHLKLSLGLSLARPISRQQSTRPCRSAPELALWHSR